jgi:hypothetical protein
MAQHHEVTAMTVKQKCRYDMLTRVNRFGVAHAAAFQAASVGAQLFAALRESLVRLPNEFGAQANGYGRAREAMANKLAARESLYAALCALNRTARALAIDRPGLRGKFRLPSRDSDEALVAAARMCAGDAKRWTPIFVAYGLRAGFVDDLRAGIARFERAIADRTASRRAHVTARAGIEATLADSCATVRRLDAVVPNVLADDGAALGAWRRARRIAWRRPSKDRPARRTKARPTVIQPQNEKDTGGGGHRRLRAHLDGVSG